MSIIDIDMEIIELQREYDELSVVYEQNASEIQNLEDEQETIESDMDGIENKIQALKQQILTLEFDELNIETNDPFLKEFIKCSWFCVKDNTRPILGGVYMNGNEMVACDAYKLIVNKTIKIPEKLQGKIIPYDTRSDFDNCKFIDGSYLKYSQIIPENSKCKASVTCNKETLKNILELSDYDKNIFKLTIVGENIYFNKEFFNTALSVFDNQEFTVYYHGSVSPMMLENNNYTVLVLPVRRF